MNEQQHPKSEPIRWGIVGVIAACTLIGVLGFKLLWMIDGYRSMIKSWPYDAQYLIHPMMRVSLVMSGLVFVYRMARPEDRVSMGLRVGWPDTIKGLGLGFACTLPMLLLGLMSESFTPTRYEILYTAITPGITEEIFYRAFMFGLLVQVARCPLWQSAIITGLIFGLAHVDITPDAGQTILGQIGPWIAMIGVGGFMYAWLYWESRWNLWVVIALHIGMNLWWDMFDLTLTPLGNWGATLVRVVSVGLAVLFVFHYRVLSPKPTTTINP